MRRAFVPPNHQQNCITWHINKEKILCATELCIKKDFSTKEPCVFNDYTKLLRHVSHFYLHIIMSSVPFNLQHHASDCIHLACVDGLERLCKYIWYTFSAKLLLNSYCFLFVLQNIRNVAL